MKKFLITVLSLTFVLMSVGSVDFNCRNIVQLSKENQNADSDVRRLQASIVPCQNQHRVKCQPHIQIRAWIDPKTDEQTFLLIDEVHDAKERTNLQLMSPYLIQVSTGEHTSMYPLVLNQVVDVTCPQNEPMQRRTADNGETLANEGAKIFLHLFFRSFFN